jgi:hypothetical protein
MTSIMDDITVFATLLALVVTSVGFVVYYNEKEEVDADSAPVLVDDDDKPLPLKEDVLKASEIAAASTSSQKIDDSDALTADTVDSSDDDAAAAGRVDDTKRGLLKAKKVLSKRWSRTKEPTRDPKKKMNMFWRLKKKEQRATETVGYEV